MTKERVTKLTERGYCYLDMYVAGEFASETGVPETDVLSVLRRQTAIYLTEEQGRGKHDRAVDRACMALAHGYETTYHGTNAEALARLEFATAYAVLVRRDNELREARKNG